MIKVSPNGWDKPLVYSIPSLTSDFPIIDWLVDLPGCHTAKCPRYDRHAPLILDEVDTPKTSTAHAPKVPRQLVEIVVHSFKRQEPVLLSADMPHA